MLTELLPSSYKFAFGEAEIELRFTLRSFLELERLGYNYREILEKRVIGKTILAFFYAGLVTPIEAEKLPEIAEIVGYETLWEHLKKAMIQALPKKEENVVQKATLSGDEEFSFEKLRTLICDVMGKSEDFFWDSTLGELAERWIIYARTMGYAEEPERVYEFDEEGM